MFSACAGSSERGVGVLFVIEVDEMHGRAFFTCLSVFAYAGVFKQKGEGMAVVFDEIVAGEVGSHCFSFPTTQ